MNPYAALPRVDDLLDAAVDLVDRHGRRAVVDQIRMCLDDARTRIAEGADAPAADEVLAAVRAALDESLQVGPKPVINAAGVVVHTNLGRAPLSPSAVQAVVAATGYTDLEFDLEGGGRGSRGVHVDALLARAVGAEDAMVVNNCASALVLALMALATGRDVLVSRGHLVEIGGSFRLPDIMATSGARLVEVGTTNRTRAIDYSPASQAAPDAVGALLTVHPSNFVQTGFVTQPSLAEVASVAHEHGLPLVHDAGSGLLDDSPLFALADEPSMAGALRDGAGLVLASGDKLLGGPQAGLIAGSASLVERCRRHPMARALRVDKLRLAALSATLIGWLHGHAGSVVGAIDADQADLAARVEAMAASVGGEVVRAQTMIGGGSAPGVGVESPVVRLAASHPNAVAAALRREPPTPVIVRVADDALLIDLRTVEADDDAAIVEAVAAAIDGLPG